jgi:ferredoxin
MIQNIYHFQNVAEKQLEKLKKKEEQDAKKRQKEDEKLKRKLEQEEKRQQKEYEKAKMKTLRETQKSARPGEAIKVCLRCMLCLPSTLLICVEQYNVTSKL